MMPTSDKGIKIFLIRHDNREQEHCGFTSIADEFGATSGVNS